MPEEVKDLLELEEVDSQENPSQDPLEEPSSQEEEIYSSIFFVNLSLPDLIEGRSFDGVASGVFTDMFGRKVELRLEDFPEYVQNTQELIDASKTESGEVVGLPIDAADHNKGDAAGWIVGVELAGSVIRFIPRWTERGIEYLKKGIRRMFSPTISLSNKTVLGGSLTNWPATRDSRGKVLLRPIELSSSLHTITWESPSAEDRLRGFCKTSLPDCELESIHPEYLSIRSGKDDKLYRVSYTLDSSGVYNLGDPSTWEEEILPLKDPTLEGDKNMGELSQEQMAELAQKVAGILAESHKQSSPPDPLANLLELEGLTEDAKKQRKIELQGQLAAIRKQAELEYREELARLSFENSMMELSQKLTQGLDEAPRGFRVSAEELKSHLLKLPHEEAKFWGELMTHTLVDGFIEFSERGSGKAPKGTHQLPDEIVKKLDSGSFTLSDLSNPILELGDLDQYDLTKWAQK